MCKYVCMYQYLCINVYVQISVCIPLSLYIPQTALCCRGSGGVSTTGRCVGRPFPGAAVINFCAQAADLVMVASLPSMRNGRSFQFRQKNIGVWAQFTSRVVWLPRWPLGGPAASHVPPYPRCVADASARFRKKKIKKS